MLSTETLHGPEIVKEEILKIRDEHIRLIEAIRNDRRSPYHRREKVPRLDELDGAKINVIKYLHWTPIQISWYKDLCRHEWLAVLGVAHRLRTGEDERERYMKGLARVFPGQWGQHKSGQPMSTERRGLVSDDQKQNGEDIFNPEQMHEDDIDEFFPARWPREISTATSEIDDHLDNQIERLGQHNHKLVTNRLEGRPVAVKQVYLPKRLLELPQLTRKPLQIRKPKSPQASSRSPTSTISRTAPT